jgi:hypothetical protein
MDGSKMTLHVEFSDDELPKLKELLNRALNCWDPKDAPKWAYKLDALVVARINDKKILDQTGVQR